MCYGVYFVSLQHREMLYLRTLLTAFAFILVANNSYAQRYFFGKAETEFTAAIGPSIFRGDIGSSNNPKGLKEIIDYSTIGFSAQAGFRRNMKHGLAFRSELGFVRLKADDAFSLSVHRRNRNLHFKTSMVELSAELEYNLLHIFPGTRNQVRFEIYGFGGASAFYFNPTAKLNGTTQNLQPLGTEGQGYNDVKHYNRISYAALGGIGYRKLLKGYRSIGIELSLRATFSDYIDDVSGSYPDGTELLANNGEAAYELSYRGTGDFPSNQVRGNPSLNDNFGLLQFTYTQALSKRPQVFMR